MVLNYIWVAFFLIAFIIALVKLIFLGDTEVFPAMMNSTFETSKTAFEISLGLTGVLSLWLGVMKIGERGGVVNALARVLSPLFTRLFPDIPKGHPVTGYDNVPCTQYQRTDIDSREHHGLSSAAGCRQPYRHIHTHSAGHILFDAGGHYHHFFVPAHQPAEQGDAADAGWYVCNCRCNHLGLRTT